MQIGQFGLFKVTNFVTLKQAKIFFGILFSHLHASNLQGTTCMLITIYMIYLRCNDLFIYVYSCVATPCAWHFNFM